MNKILKANCNFLLSKIINFLTAKEGFRILDSHQCDEGIETTCLSSMGVIYKFKIWCPEKFENMNFNEGA